jgi:hypothetical protein
MNSQRGKPVAVAPSPETDEEISQQKLRESLWRAAERIQERNRDMDPEEELAFITEVVEEVRGERYEREQSQATRGC